MRGSFTELRANPYCTKPEQSKPLTGEVVQAAQVVITIGCGDACPLYPFKKYQDWMQANRPQRGGGGGGN